MQHKLRTQVHLLLGCLCITYSAAANYTAEESVRVGSQEAQSGAIHRIEPVYPESARRRKIESRVEIDAYVETDGSVSSTVVVCGDLALVDAAAAAAKQWKFEPFRKDGRPVRAVTRLVFQMKPPVVTRASR